jgi:sec-independent protein translocase protein TatA
MLSTPELIIIFLIIMLVFGGTRLPAVGRGLGESVRQFRDGLKQDGSKANSAPAVEDTAKAPAAPDSHIKRS